MTGDQQENTALHHELSEIQSGRELSSAQFDVSVTTRPTELQAESMNYGFNDYQ